MNIKMDEAITQIKNAIVNGRTDIVNALLQQCVHLGEDTNRILTENFLQEGTFLHFATGLDKYDIVRALLNAGADPSVENREGENAYELCRGDSMQQVYISELLRVTARSNIKRMEEFFKAGLDPNCYDCEEKRNSILHWAVSFANAETIKFLIERGSDVNSVTVESVTPLHDAVDRGDVEIIEALLKANASPLIKAEQGKFENKSPLDLASQKPEIFSLMSQYLANQFKTHRLAQRSVSIDSVSVFSPNSPDSPPYSHSEIGAVRSRLSGMKMSCSSIENFSQTIHSGFDSSLERVIRGLELKAPIQPIITDSNLSNLWPQPKSLMCLEGLQFRPEKVLHVSVVKPSNSLSVHRILDIFSSYKDSFECLGFRTTCCQVESKICSNTNTTFHSSQVQCSISSDVLPGPSSYKLHISSIKVRITGYDIAGLRYGISTFLQLLMLYSNENEPTAIPPLVINDQPSLKHRAVFLDISSERIPNIDSIIVLIRSLSLFKINYIHFHMRFDKTANLTYTKGELIAIDRLCEDVGIRLIPAFDVPCNLTTAEYFQHVKPVISELLSCFSSTNYIHIGPQLTALIFMPENEQNGGSIGFNAIYDYVPISSSDTTILLCHNAITSALKGTLNPTSLLNVPSNVILVEYGFQADYNFGPSLQLLAQNGCSSLVMAGTSAWSSLAGCPEAALCNLFHSTSNAVSNSSLGLIVANWSGSCNLTPRVFAWPGFLLAAGLSWNHQTHWEYLQGSLAHLMSTYVLRDPSGISGQVVLQLGCAESSLLRSELGQATTDMTNLPPSQGTTIYRFITNPDSVPLENITLEAFIKCVKSIKKCQNSLAESKMEIENNSIFKELNLTMELMLLGCRIGRRLLSAGINPRSNMGLTAVNLGVANLQPVVKTDIANKLLTVIEEYQRIWMKTNYPQGLETSLYTLTTTLQRFIPDSSKLITGRLSSSESSKLSNGYEHTQNNNSVNIHNGRGEGRVII